MKIVIISKYARTPEDGQPTRHYFFAKHFAKAGKQVLLIKSRSNLSQKTPQFSSPYREQLQDQIRVTTLNGQIISSGFGLKRIWSWLLFEWRLLRYFSEIKKFSPDVVVVSSLSILTFLSGVYFKWRLKVPLVLEVRDIYPLTLIEVGKFSPTNPFVKLLGLIERFGYKKADLIVSSLENCDQHIRSVTTNSFSFAWIPTGYEKDYYKEAISEESAVSVEIKKLKAQGKFIVGYAGTIGLANSLDNLLQAAAEVAKYAAKIHFVLIGDGPIKKELQANYSQLENVSYFDPVEKDKLPSVLTSCDLLVHLWRDLPLYRFGISPNKWIDYMNSARPFILSHNYKSRIFEEANCGWQIAAQDLKQLANKIIEVSQISEQELTLIGKNGKRYLEENLSYQLIADQYLKSLEGLIVCGPGVEKAR